MAFIQFHSNMLTSSSLSIKISSKPFLYLVFAQGGNILQYFLCDKVYLLYMEGKVETEEGIKSI